MFPPSCLMTSCLGLSCGLKAAWGQPAAYTASTAWSQVARTRCWCASVSSKRLAAPERVAPLSRRAKMPHCNLRAAAVLFLVILKEQPSSSAPLNGKVSFSFFFLRVAHTQTLNHAWAERSPARFLQDKIKSLPSEQGRSCVASTFSGRKCPLFV